MVCPEEMEPDLQEDPARGQAEGWEKGKVRAAGGVQALSVSVSALPAARSVHTRLGFPVPRCSVLSAGPQ
jgi:hypothetical protein